MMELRNILTFIRVAELGSFSKAAESMGYAQSTVTIQIQQLEEELGRPLFDRINRRIALTDFGEQVLPLARRIRNTEKEISTLDISPEKLSGTLRIGVVESLIFSNFLALIAKYRSIYPNVVLDFHIASSVEIVESLRNNRLDIGCYLANGDVSSDVVYHYLKPAPVVFVVNRSHPLADKPHVSNQDISNERFILTEDNSIYNHTLRTLFQKYSLTVKESIYLKSTRGIVDLLKYSGGISFLPEYVVANEVQHGNLSIISSDFPCVEITLAVTTHKNKWISPKMKGLLELIKTERWI